MLLVIHLFCTDLHLDLEVEHLLVEVVWQYACLKNVKAVEACLYRYPVLAQQRIFLVGEVLAVLALLLRCLLNILRLLLELLFLEPFGGIGKIRG